MSQVSKNGLKAFVAVKRVIDYAVKPRVRGDKKWMEVDGVKHSMNPFDEIAVEAALRLKTANIVSHITVVSCGGSKCQDTLRSALALGADEAVHVELSEGSPLAQDGHLQPLSVAKILAALAGREKPDLFFLGKQAIDDDSNQTGQLLAGLLNWPQTTFASNIDFTSDGAEAKITREVDGGLEVLKVKPPFVLTTDLRLNEPRYATLQNIMKAKKIPIKKETLDSLGLKEADLLPRLNILEVVEPKKRSGGKKVESVDELIKCLREEAQVL